MAEIVFGNKALFRPDPAVILRPAENRQPPANPTGQREAGPSTGPMTASEAGPGLATGWPPVGQGRTGPGPG